MLSGLLFIPEIFLSVCIVSLLMFNLYSRKFYILRLQIFSEVFLILVTAVLILLYYKISSLTAGGGFIFDSSTTGLKLLFLLFCLVSICLVWRSFVVQNLNFIEFFILYLLTVLSSLLLLSSFDLLTIYLCIELQSICFYILSAFYRGSSFSAEAGLKYFISSAFMSCVFLLGASILYGCLGSLNFSVIGLLTSIAVSPDSLYILPWVVVGCFLVSIFFLFKISIAPFHFFFPQIYDGSPLASTVIFLLLPKFIIVSVFLRWLLVLSYVSVLLKSTLLWSGVYSVVMGTFLALHQKKIKKLFIYSSIGQLGLPVAVLSVLSYNSVVNLYFFLVIYTLTNVVLWGAFLIGYSSRKTEGGSSPLQSYSLYLTELTNTFYWSRVWSVILAVVFFSMCGIPPLSGFMAKMFLYFEIIYSENFIVAVFLILIGAFSAFYYLKILKISFFESAGSLVLNKQITHYYLTAFAVDCSVYSFLGFLLIFFGLCPDGLILICQALVVGFSFV